MGPQRNPRRSHKNTHHRLKKVVEDHENFIEDRLAKLTLKLDLVTGEEFVKEVKAENEDYKKIINELKKTIK